MKGYFSAMYDDLFLLIHKVPYRPFTVCLTDQRQIAVPTRDHVMLTKKGTLIVQDDKGLVDIISPGQIASVQFVEDSAAA